MFSRPLKSIAGRRLVVGALTSPARRSDPADPRRCHPFSATADGVPVSTICATWGPDLTRLAAGVADRGSSEAGQASVPSPCPPRHLYRQTLPTGVGGLDVCPLSRAAASRAAAGTCSARDDGHARSRPACLRSWPTSVSPPQEPDAPAPAARPAPRLRVPGRVRDWLGHRRTPAVTGRRLAHAARECRGHRGWPVRDHPDLRAGFRRALQPSRFGSSTPTSAGCRGATRSPRNPRPGCRLHHRPAQRQRHVALTAISISAHHRASGAHFFAEVIATAGLLLVIFSLARTSRATRPSRSTTVGVMSLRTFAGAPVSVPGFVRDNIHCRTPTALMKLCARAGSVRL
jgi:hypothetical protein